MDIKAHYFAEIEPYIKAEIDKQIEVKFREELYEKLYNFFDCYLNETGTVFFANSQIHKNLYEKVYSDRDDVSLFWKTQKLYYVKSEANYENLQTEINGIKILFDASEIKNAKGNEKKAIQFYLIKATKEEVIFKIRYQEGNRYDRLKEYVEVEIEKETQKQNAILDRLLDEFETPIHPNLVFAKTDIDRSVFASRTDSRKCLYIENIDDALNSVKVEYSINDLSLMLTYLRKKGIILFDEDLKKIFGIYKRQNEIDYFIHKDAEGFLKEQFDIYIYNWLFNDLGTDFDVPTVNRMQNIKKISHKVIEYIARFEDELKAIWEKPKFARNCNYVLTLEKLADNVQLIKKIIACPEWKNQLAEWEELSKDWYDEKEKVSKKGWKNFKKLIELKSFIEKNKLVDEAKLAPIDTKHFPSLKNEILETFKNLDEELNGTLVKTDNWQGLNTLSQKFTESSQIIYIDPPFNTGDDFLYKDKYQDSTWITLMENRLELSKKYLNKNGFFWLHLDYRASHFGKMLLEKAFKKENLVNEIIWSYSGNSVPKKCFPRKHDNIWFFKNSENSEIYFDRVLEPYSELTLQRYNHTDENGKKYKISALANGKQEIVPAGDGKYPDDVWSIPVPRAADELVDFTTQKPMALIDKIIKCSSNENDLVIDYFSGSGTTLTTAQATNRRWLGMEIGEHFYSRIIPRLKNTLTGSVVGKFKEEMWSNKNGGLFKYFELEQYEDVLSRAKFRWQGENGINQVEKYTFMQDQKLLEAIEIDYTNKNAKVVFENLYPDVDIAETLSNLSGKHIKQILKDKVVFEDGSEVVYAELTFEKYPWIKPLIWWNSK